MTQPSTPQQNTPQLDSSIRPQDDFFGHVNNHWIQSHPIPESETHWGTFNVLRDESLQAMHAIFEDVQKQRAATGTIQQQAGDFYYTGMHFDTLKPAHRQLIDNIFQKIDGVRTTADLSAMIGALHAMDIGGPWYNYVDSDHDDSSKHIFHFHQSGLTLPSRDYYLEEDDKMRRVRTAYKRHLQKVYEHFPQLAKSGAVFCKTLVDFETAIARVSRSSSDLRDVENNYHKTTLTDVIKTYNNIDMLAYAKGLGWRADDKITVDQPEFMTFINDSFSSRPLDDWKLYLKWRFLTSCLAKVDSEMAQLQFEFFGGVLGGTTEIMPLWKRVIRSAERALGEATGRLYAAKHFPESSKQQVLSLVERLRQAYGERIDQLDWMSADTKKYAKQKLANIKVLIGYPDVWRDFSGLTIDRTSYLGNTLAAQKFEVAYWLGKLHEPTSREDWLMTPQTVNAYNDPTRLVICFPAAILQAPFFDPAASLAVNMGGIGMAIGHELTHGFDDQGCLFDARGNVRNWQTDVERKAFAKKAQVIVDQADAFEVLPGLTLRGKLVLGESIADLGGIELALQALKHQSSVSPQDLKDFFINYAFSECVHMRPEKLRELTLADPHPAAPFRVNGMLRHVNDFYAAFNVVSSDALYLTADKQTKIW